jgi:oligopeptidase B
MRMHMGAGHGGSSGRYERYREMAFRYAFVVDQIGVPVVQ